MTDAIMDKLRALRSELNCRREHGAEGAEHLLYAEVKLGDILKAAGQPPPEARPMQCPFCGAEPTVDEGGAYYTVRHHDHCYLADGIPETILSAMAWNNRQPCPECRRLRFDVDALRKDRDEVAAQRATAEKRGKTLEAAVQLAKLDNDSLSAGLHRWQTEFALVSSQRDAALQACRSALSEIQSGDIGHMCRAGDILAVALRTRG